MASLTPIPRTRISCRESWVVVKKCLNPGLSRLLTEFPIFLEAEIMTGIGGLIEVFCGESFDDQNKI